MNICATVVAAVIAVSIDLVSLRIYGTSLRRNEFHACCCAGGRKFQGWQLLKSRLRKTIVASVVNYSFAVYWCMTSSLWRWSRNHLPNWLAEYLPQVLFSRLCPGWGQVASNKREERCVFRRQLGHTVACYHQGWRLWLECRLYYRRYVKMPCFTMLADRWHSRFEDCVWKKLKRFGTSGSRFGIGPPRCERRVGWAWGRS